MAMHIYCLPIFIVDDHVSTIEQAHITLLFFIVTTPVSTNCDKSQIDYTGWNHMKQMISE